MDFFSACFKTHIGWSFLHLKLSWLIYCSLWCSMPVLSTLKIVVWDLLGCLQIFLFAVLFHRLTGNLDLNFSDGSFLVIWTTWSDSWPCKMGGGGEEKRKKQWLLIGYLASHERLELVCSVLFFVIWIWCGTRTILSQIGPRTLFWVGWGVGTCPPASVRNGSTRHVQQYRGACSLPQKFPKMHSWYIPS